MDHGPYRYVRHPRYSAAIVAKVAFALALASILGWVLSLGDSVAPKDHCRGSSP
jgi:protein-S-isoprenylcysteine O-methyltransferase Ste14